MKLITYTFAFLISTNAVASVITIDPDDFAPGTLLTGNIDNINITTVQGDNVYASPLFGDGRSAPPGFVESGPFGDRVFSLSPTTNSEWLYDDFIPDDSTIGDLRLLGVNGFMVEFLEPVNYLSIFNMELFDDAGWGDDPVLFYLYDTEGHLIHRQDNPIADRTVLPGTVPPELGPFPGFSPYVYWRTEFFFPEIGYLIVDGNSEPTTLDRLVYKHAEVTEPAPLILLTFGLTLIGVRLRRRIHKLLD